MHAFNMNSLIIFLFLAQTIIVSTSFSIVQYTISCTDLKLFISLNTII